MATGEQIAQTTLQAIERKGGYIYGQQGAIWTAAKQAALEKKYKADPDGMKNYAGSVQYGKKWIDHPVWDCAGLCRWAAAQHGVAIHSGSNLIWKYDLEKKGALTNDTDLPVGALVFTGNDSQKPHIGTYTGGGMVTEAAGAKTGCVQSALHSKWKYWGLEKGVQYSGEPGPDKPIPEGYARVTGKRVALRKDPSTSAVIITRVNTGELVKLEQEPEKAWDYVRYNGKTGWMMRAYLEEHDDNAIVTGKRVALRVDPSLRAKIITRIDTGKIVWLEKEPEKKWDYVSYQGNKGWMTREFLEEGK